MRTAAGLLALTLAACTSPAARPAPSAVPAPPRPSARATSAPKPLAYVPELATGATHTLVAARGVVYLFDDTGRLVTKRSMPGGGEPRFALGSDGRTTYAVVGRHDGGLTRLMTYDGGRFAEVASHRGWYPRRFERGGTVYRTDDETIVRERPRGGRWTLPPLAGYARGAKGWRHGDDPAYLQPLLAVTVGGGPVVAHEMLGRCVVSDLDGGRQAVLDAPPPHHLRECADAAIGPDGDVTLVARDGGDHETGRDDVFAIVRVDPVTLAERPRVPLRTMPEAYNGYSAALVSLPGGLVAYVRARGGAGGAFVADLRGPEPVLHPVPDLGYEAAAAGPDAIFVWGDGGGVARVTVSTGRVERAALRVTGRVSGVLRVR